MTNKIKLILLVMLCGTNSSAKSSLFSDSTQFGRIADMEQNSPWLQSSNAAGLYSLSQSLSEATVFVQKQNGKFVNYYESDDSFNWGAQASAFMRLNERTVLSGAIAYDYFKGKHMGGSFFMEPEQMPFDLVDFDINNRGEKQKEIYHLRGAVSYDLTPHWTFGANIDYTAGNYAKQKDLRHTNELMNICTSVGAIFKTKRWDVGANYLFRKRNEGIIFATYGTTEEVYNSLISYGGFWGVVEQFGVIGYIDKNEQKPLIDKYHGGAIQLKWTPSSSLSLYNEIEYLSRKGFYGIPGTRKITYTNHDGDVLLYKGHLNIFGKKNIHHIFWSYQHEGLNNKENIFRFESGPGGLDEIKYFGSLETLDRKLQHIGIDYIGNFGRKDQIPVWTVKGGFHYDDRDVKASFYPFFRKQKIHTSTFHLSAEFHLHRSKHLFNILLGTQFSKGDGTAAKDGVYAPPGSNQKPPKNSPDYLNHEFEYLTATKMRHQIGCEYSRKIRKTKVHGFGGINYQFLHAFNTKYVDSAHQHSVQFHVGCVF